ncbi:MAG: zinc ribbon domain-containing protein [Desulfosporosinus sp.]
MSFKSRSSKENHYKSGNHGSRHYQKKGFLGNLLNMVGSRSGSNNYGNRRHNAPVEKPIANQNAIICGKCNSSIPAGSKFCLQCGEKVNDILFCLNCGEKLPSGAKFCLKCGAKING